MDEEQSFMPPSQSQFYEFISSAAAAEFQRDMPFQIFQCDTMPRIATPCFATSGAFTWYLSSIPLCEIFNQATAASKKT